MVTAVVVVVVVLMLVGLNAEMRECPFCGSRDNRWRTEFPVCQSCGRDRT